jgi:predicted MFS family arabinose efflux permease
LTPRIFLIIALTCAGFTSFNGSRVLMSLYAYDLKAGAFGIGILVSLYSLFPLLLSVMAGRVSDRFGVRRPIVMGSAGTAIGFTLPDLFPQVEVLYVSAILIGLSFVFQSVAVQNLVPSLPGKGQDIADAEQRTKNVSNFSLGISVAQFFGPLIAGFGSDFIGHRHTFLVFAVLAMVPAIAFYVRPRLVPRRTRRGTSDYVKQSPMDLLKQPGLRRTFITSGVIMAGVDLFVFYTPIFGRSIGLSGSVIGVILAVYAAAQFIIRFFLPAFARRFGEDRVLNVTMVFAAITYLAFPFFREPLVLGAVAFLLGLGLGCGQPLSMIQTYNRSPAGRSGEALGIRFSVINFVHMAVPLLFGSIGASIGLVGVYWGNAAFLGAGALFNAKARKT